MITHWSNGLMAEPACGDANVGRLTRCSALMFMGLRHHDPQKYCAACFIEAEKMVNGSARTDSERYAELRALVEAYQNAKSYEDDEPLRALRDWSHR